jgi:hypothetical protein
VLIFCFYLLKICVIREIRQGGPKADGKKEKQAGFTKVASKIPQSRHRCFFIIRYSLLDIGYSLLIILLAATLLQGFFAFKPRY